MRSTLTWMAVAAVMAGAILAGTAPVAAQTSENIRVDLNLRDADVLAATRMLTSQTGLQFIVEPSSDPFPRITLSLAGVTAEDAIKYICQSAGAYFRRDDNGVYIISRTKPVEPAKPILDAPPVKPKLKITKIRLMKADAEVVYSQIRGIPFDPLRGYLELDRFEQATDPSRRNMHEAGNMYVLGANDSRPTFQPVSTQNFTQPRTGSEAGSDIRLPGEQAGQGEGGVGDFGGGQQGGLGDGGQGFGGDQGGGQGQGGQIGGGLARGGLIPNVQFLSYDPNDNSIVVQGTDEQIRELQDAIAFFDVAPKQVIVKVEFVTTSNSLNRSLGFEFFYQRGPLFVGPRPGSFARNSDPFFLSYATGNVSMRLRANLQEGFGKVVNAPILRTLNNQPAVVRQGVQTNIFIPQTTVSNGTVITNFQVRAINANTVLAIRPRINGDGTITMFLAPTISDFGQIRVSPTGQQIPDVLFQNISVVARVKSGETIVLAGLTRKSDLGTQQRFPILGDLPLIGQFFRSTTKDKNVSELLVFVTPTVVEDEDNMGLGP